MPPSIPLVKEIPVVLEDMPPQSTQVKETPVVLEDMPPQSTQVKETIPQSSPSYITYYASMEKSSKIYSTTKSSAIEPQTNISYLNNNQTNIINKTHLINTIWFKLLISFIIFLFLFIIYYIFRHYKSKHNSVQWFKKNNNKIGPLYLNKQTQTNLPKNRLPPINKKNKSKINNIPKCGYDKNDYNTSKNDYNTSKNDYNILIQNNAENIYDDAITGTRTNSFIYLTSNKSLENNRIYNNIDNNIENNNIEQNRIYNNETYGYNIDPNRCYNNETYSYN